LRVPVSWLRDYVAIDMPLPELAERLSVASAEVEGIERRSVSEIDGNLAYFRVGRVLEAGKHPNADRLQLCQVDVGEAEPRQIVCGAWNFGPGATVAVALPGAVLANGTKLEPTKLRGELSKGMILAEDEVELGPDHGGIMVLADEWEPGTPLQDALPLVEDVLLVESTGNRPDLMSVYGIAREVAAIYDLELSPPPGRDPGVADDERVDVRIDDLEGCPRYVGRLFRDVRIGPSPQWLRTRLSDAGMRPISNVVDVTNYAMLALGNPLHAFDYAKLHEGRIVVRRARRGETLRTLDGVVRELEETDLMIADADRSVALAGIMGGEETEIGDETTDVLLEAANFEPYTIFRTSERLRLRTEGSNRWEKGVDPHLAPQAAALATQLIVELTGARWTGDVDVHGDLPPRASVEFRPERADALVGLEVPAGDQHALLGRLGFDVDGDSVVVPTWRARDVTREVDVVEEVARFHLGEVPYTLPLRRAMFGRLTRDQRLRRRVEDILTGLGFSEVYTPSLVEDDPDSGAVRLNEPISVELAVLRTTLLPSIVEAARRNAQLGNERISLFEIARVYEPSGGELPVERLHLSLITAGGYSRVKGVADALARGLHAELRFAAGSHPLLHPTRAARTGAGIVGELHPTELEGEWGVLELDLGLLFEEVQEPIVYHDVLAYPAVRQELAFVLDVDVPAADVLDAARRAAPEVREVRFLSDYRGEPIPAGKKSLAFSVAFQSAERTLTDEEAASLRARVIEAIENSFRAELRA
jgi:phenylalanyl-tRNA synthetase beta chain